MQKKLDRNYYAAIGVARDIDEAGLKKAYRQAILTAHPDKGGSTKDAQRLNAARDAWLHSRGSDSGACRPQQQHTAVVAVQAPRQRASTDSTVSLPLPLPGSSRKQFRINTTAVLLTYQGLPKAALKEWKQFIAFVRGNKAKWSVKHWCATLETNADGTYHAHSAGYRLKPKLLAWQAPDQSGSGKPAPAYI